MPKTKASPATVNEKTIAANAEELMELTLTGGSTAAIRAKAYDEVIEKFRGMGSLEAVLTSMKLSEYIAPYDPYKYRELAGRMLEHIVNPNIQSGTEEPVREHDEPPGPGLEVVKAAQEAKAKARAEAEAKHPKPKPKVQKTNTKKTDPTKEARK